MNTNIQKSLHQFSNYDLLIICDCLINSKFFHNYSLDIPFFIIYFKQINYNPLTTYQNLLYNRNISYLTILEKISEFAKNPYIINRVFTIFYIFKYLIIFLNEIIKIKHFLLQY